VIRGSTDKVDPLVRSNFEQSIARLKDVADCPEVELPDLPYGTVVGTVISCEMASAFEEFIRSGKVWELTAPEDRWGGHSNLAIPAKDYIHAQRIRGRIQRAIDELLTEYDALAAPTLTTVAGPIDTAFRDWSKGFSSSSLGVAGNAAGAPALTIPNGFGADDLPTGLHLLSRAGEENRLLGLAAWYQSHTDWHRRHPDVA
jgi:aspartyl-tRNA(Asn)/glutamyl-tRNA(Gln) amidotransferase subunit A